MAENPLKRRTFTSPPSSAFSPCYSNVKQVYLSEWWLIKPDGDDCRGLRIGGINSNRRLGIRVFRSAEIQKRHDSVTLETADGITVYICGNINRSRTFENGFSQQVCDHFGFGFPYDWDEFVDGSFPEDRADSKFTGWTGNLPTCLIRDFAPSIELSTSMFEDILQKFGTKAKDEASQSSHTNDTQNITDKDAAAAQPNPETEPKEGASQSSYTNKTQNITDKDAAAAQPNPETEPKEGASQSSHTNEAQNITDQDAAAAQPNPETEPKEGASQSSHTNEVRNITDKDAAAAQPNPETEPKEGASQSSHTNETQNITDKDGASQSSHTNETQNITDKDAAPTKGKKRTAAQPIPEPRMKKLLKTAVDGRISSDCNVTRKGPLTRSMAHMVQLEKKKNETDMARLEKKKKNETGMAQSEKKKKKENDAGFERPLSSVRAPKPKGSQIAGKESASSTSAAPEIGRLNLRNRTVERIPV